MQLRAEVFKALCRFTTIGDPIERFPLFDKLRLNQDEIHATNGTLAAIVDIDPGVAGDKDVLIDPRHVAGQLAIEPEMVSLNVFPMPVENYPNIKELIERNTDQSNIKTIRFNPEILKAVCELAIACQSTAMELEITGHDKPVRFWIEGETSAKGLAMPMQKRSSPIVLDDDEDEEDDEAA